MLEVTTARILVNQVAASKTAIFIPLLSSSAGAYIGDVDGPVSTTNQMICESLASASIFRREASKYAELISQNPWRLETLVSSTGNAVGAVSLYNITRSGHVDDTESMFTGSNIQLSISPFQEGVTGFSSANEMDLYQVALRCVAECGSGQARLSKAGLWVHLKNLDKARVVFRTSLGATPSSPTHYEHQRTRVDLSQFSNPVSYFQATATILAGMNSGTVWLSDVGSDDSGLTNPTLVPSSELTVNSNTKSLYRSPALAPTSGHRFVPSVDPGSAMLQITDSAIIIDVSH